MTGMTRKWLAVAALSVAVLFGTAPAVAAAEPGTARAVVHQAALQAVPTPHAQQSPQTGHAQQTGWTQQSRPTQRSPHAQRASSDSDGGLWGLLGLLGLFGLFGVARRRPRRVVADPLAAYPVLNEPMVPHQREPLTPAHGTRVVAPAAQAGVPADVPSGVSGFPPSTPFGAPVNGSSGTATSGLVSEAIPRQEGGFVDHRPTGPSASLAARLAAGLAADRTAEKTDDRTDDLTEDEPLPRPRPGGTATSVTGDGGIRLPPAPPLHAQRYGRPDLSVYEPKWPQQDQR